MRIIFLGAALLSVAHADASLPAAASTVVDGETWINALVSDGRELFYSVGNGTEYELRALPVTGGQPRRLMKKGWPQSLAVVGEWIYFEDGGALRRVDKRGRSLETVVENLGSVQAHLVGSDAGWLYTFAPGYSLDRWSARDGAHERVAEWNEDHEIVAGHGGVFVEDRGELHALGSARALTTTQLALAMAVDQKYIYAFDECRGLHDEDVFCLWRVSRSGGAREPIARWRPRHVLNGALLAVDDRAVYLAVTDYGRGQILRLPK